MTRTDETPDDPTRLAWEKWYQHVPHTEADWETWYRRDPYWSQREFHW